jgi:hypothetical protein
MYPRIGNAAGWSKDQQGFLVSTGPLLFLRFFFAFSLLFVLLFVFFCDR